MAQNVFLCVSDIKLRNYSYCRYICELAVYCYCCYCV